MNFTIISKVCTELFSLNMIFSMDICNGAFSSSVFHQIGPFFKKTGAQLELLHSNATSEFEEQRGR